MRNTALFVSFVFHPIFLPTAGLLAIFSLNTYIAQTTPMPKQLFLVGWIFVNTTVIPLIFTLFLRWKNLVSSVHLHDRRERIVPIAFAFVLYLANYILMRDVPLPDVIYSLFLGSSIAVGAALLFTFLTKISIHMIGMGGLTASIYGVAQLYELPIVGFVMLGILVSGLVGSARYLLDSHDLRQIYLGWITGFVTVYVPLIGGWG
ncbi:MAG: hypothetical protein HN542_08440 [Flavobacteriales bacterium]|jgi:hypothetical protein|nr:hypothetical protein [Flavobacteriales bacterium]NCG30270.1 hypothetical protein [Bacteroidota bacterium]MBT3962978.1 hypothetical protein [Flavobacteriales bacterium]MBT4705601.1 hypothetical protein [Flavobacteriales bacterium]MBT4931140.1 hypothetical protein [Flavobacteriales bacterium]